MRNRVNLTIIAFMLGFLSLEMSTISAFAMTGDTGAKLLIAAERGDKHALNRLQSESKSGDAVAQEWLGLYYTFTDPSKAPYWLEKSAKQGDASAQYTLGAIYEYGKGVPKNYPKALYWFRKLAAKNDSDAELDLASMYEDGRGVKQDYTQAAYWYTKAANQGELDAQLRISAYYAAGRGVKHNDVEAYKWALLASSARTGSRVHKLAENLLPYLAHRMTKEQIEKAKSEAKAWRDRKTNAKPPQTTSPSASET